MNILNRNARTTGLILLTVAIVAVGLTTDFGMVQAYRRLLTVTQSDGKPSSRPPSARRLSAANRLILDGEATRPSYVLRQRAIWEAAPTNKVFFNHYLTSLLSDYSTLGASADACYHMLAKEIEAGRSVDPNNARLDFMLAAKLLEQAMESKTAVTGVTADGKAKVRSEQVVKDRAKLAEAMTLLARGLKRPVYRRYVGEMLAVRLAILGEPRSLSDQMLQLNLAADTPMPDLPLMRNLSRGASAYAAVLTEEKRLAEAQFFLEAWKPLALKLTADSFALIDVLMAAAIIKEAELRVPELYTRMGMAAKADAVRAETRALTAPLVVWNKQRNAFQNDPAIRLQREAFSRHTGILATMLLPALTEYPSAAELAPNRLLDYILIEDLFLTGVAILMLVGMLAGLLWLRHLRRLVKEGDLAPDGVLWRQAAIRAGWCVFLPVLVYLVITRFTDLDGRLYGLPYLWPRLVFQLGMLGLTMVLISTLFPFSRWTPASLPASDRARDGAVHPGCLPSTRIKSWSRLLFLLPLGVLAGAFLLPVSWLTAEHRTASLAAMWAPLVLLAGVVGWRMIRDWRVSRRTASTVRYEGTVVMVLMLGLGVLGLTLGVRRVLRIEERRCVRQETLLKVDPAQGGFTVAEARLAKTLRDQVLKAGK